MTKNLTGKKIRMAVYVDPEVYQVLTQERRKTKESESGIAASILDCFVRESAKMATDEAAN
jgi:hypothetical protein